MIISKETELSQREVIFNALKILNRKHEHPTRKELTDFINQNKMYKGELQDSSTNPRILELMADGMVTETEEKECSRTKNIGKGLRVLDLSKQEDLLKYQLYLHNKKQKANSKKDPIENNVFYGAQLYDLLNTGSKDQKIKVLKTLGLWLKSEIDENDEVNWDHVLRMMEKATNK